MEKPRKIPPALSQEKLSQLPTHGPGVRSIVALSPTPIPPEPSPKIPLAETRGQFAVSPEANTASATPSPGSKSVGPEAAGIGNSPSAPLGNAAAEVAAAQARTAACRRVVAAAMERRGNWDSEGSGNGGAGNGAGRGEGVGSALGTGAGTTAGSGTGSGSGHGGGSFPGITIQGGRLEGRN